LIGMTAFEKEKSCANSQFRSWNVFSDDGQLGGMAGARWHKPLKSIPQNFRCKGWIDREQRLPNVWQRSFQLHCYPNAHSIMTLTARAIISLFICPSAETIAVRGAKHLKIFIESPHEGCNNSIRLTTLHPFFGWGWTTEDELNKLQPLVGDIIDIR